MMRAVAWFLAGYCIRSGPCRPNMSDVNIPLYGQEQAAVERIFASIQVITTQTS